MSQNAVANVPAIDPAVETENRRPAVRPTNASSRDAMRTAIGVTVASTMLAGANRIAAAISGSSRGPGSQSPTKRRTPPPTRGTASPSSAPQTNSELPNAGASTRDAASSSPSSTAPEKNVVTASAAPRALTPFPHAKASPAGHVDGRAREPARPEDGAASVASHVRQGEG